MQRTWIGVRDTLHQQIEVCFQSKVLLRQRLILLLFLSVLALGSILFDLLLRLLALCYRHFSKDS